MNTPKATPRLLYTRSQNSRAINNQSIRKIGQKSKHGSIEKHKEISYMTIINKLISITDYKKFILFASKYVDRSILECEQQPHQPHRLSASKDIASLLTTDGIFVRKLAQLSQKPVLVCNRFLKQVKVNRKLLLEFYSSLNQVKESDKNEFQEKPSKKIQTEQQKQYRLLGYSKLNKNNESQKKERKITFEEYIKSNRKSHEIYLRIKKQYQQRQKNEGAQPKRQSLKRNDINQKYRGQRLVKQITKEVLQEMNPTQQSIMKKFPNLTDYIDKCRVKSITILDVVGQLNNYKVFSVGIEFEDTYRIMIEKAIMIEKQEENNEDMEMKDEPYIKLLLRQNQLQNENKIKQ